MKHLFAQSTPRQRLLCAACLLAALALIAADVTLIHAQQTQPLGAVCPPGNVKYEVDAAGYEYTDNSAFVDVTADAHTVNWQPAPGHVITGVCIKIGGPGGGMLIFPPVGSPPFVSTTYAVSHVVLTTALPTAVRITQLTVDPQPAAFDYRYTIVGLVLLAVLLIGAWTIHDLRKEH